MLGDDVGRLGRVVSNLGPELLHNAAHAIGVAGAPAAPHLSEEHLRRHHPSPVDRQDAQQFEFRGRERDRAADAARFGAAQELGLPVEDNRVMYPDAQLDIEDSDGRSGRVNVEIASDH